MSKNNVKKEVFSWIKSIVIALVIVVGVRHFLFAPTTVHGESMYPTFEDSNRVILNKISDVDRFDMIVFHAPDADENYIKRVIGLPGDTIEMKNDVLYINGKHYKEPYLKESKKSLAPNEKFTEDFTLQTLPATDGKVKVPKNSLFVMGDNRPVSHDGRAFGFISQKSVIGKVQFRYYPLNEVGEPK
ncbi:MULTISPECIES: signal peptidase I [Priestia]|uniref:signal peptidase I n=1 Tax=Priestia TaxID=2800373 RepID=UPI000BF6EE10|nr:signal peptidase I [Priestia aryabhattai]MBK0005728.1 signal peptidase I [Bacillus sp. S35]MCM3252133.1 signal peptidase I [Priestia aryabhattai]MCM3642156.1 signal peptidase I [Priestia aryabhattai]PFW74694.1 signal peptidase I [Priestia aryabhattai]